MLLKVRNNRRHPQYLIRIPRYINIDRNTTERQVSSRHISSGKEDLQISKYNLLGQG